MNMLITKGASAALIVLLSADAFAAEFVAPAIVNAGSAGFALSASRSIGDAALSSMRAGSDSRTVSNGAVSNTSATNVSTGSNAIANGSFAGASGLPTVIQNTGANVLIQNSTIINVQFKP